MQLHVTCLCVCEQMSAVGLTETVKGDVRKFEMWYSGREVVYVIQVGGQLIDRGLNIGRTEAHGQSSCCVTVAPGSHSGSEGVLVDGDPQNSCQPAETATRFDFFF